MAKFLAEMKIHNSNLQKIQRYSVRITAHAQQRLIERNISGELVLSSILALGGEEILSLQEQNTEIIIVDKDNNISFVIGFHKNKIHIVTAINTADVRVKRGTKIYKI